MTSGTFEMSDKSYNRLSSVYDQLKKEYDLEPVEVRNICKELETFETFAGKLINNALYDFLKCCKDIEE